VTSADVLIGLRFPGDCVGERLDSLRSSFGSEGGSMYITDIVWWAFTAYAAFIALFLIWFVLNIREKGG
jgi:hypothetical protein